MQALIRFYIFNLGYWLLVSLVARLVFVLFYIKSYPDDRWTQLLTSFMYGLRLDISMASYLVAASLILWYLHHTVNFSIFFSTYRGFGLLALSIILLITLADVAVYHHWAMKINMTALQFALHPKEVLASIGNGDQIPLLVLLYLLLMGLFSWLWFKISAQLKNVLVFSLKNLTISAITFIFIAALSLLGIRGGLQLEPINQSAVYFSDQVIYNHTAVNASWNLVNKWISNRDGKNPYHYTSPVELELTLNKFYKSGGIPVSLSDSMIKPNIVFIILEGFTADVIGAFGGERGLTPTIDSLIKQGLIFTQFYANGDRTYKGLPAILNGYPTQATASVTQNADKTGKIASIAKELSTLNYTSSFYYGGESEFANIKSYLFNTGFDKIVDIRDFPVSYRGLKWGVSDHYVFERMSEDLKSSTQPFFSCILSLSSHEPYDIPIEPLIKSKSVPDLFRNTVYYTDWSLARFIHQSENQAWYANTIFILTADHGNAMPKEYSNNYHPGRFKVPLLIFGVPLKKELRGRKMDIVGSHTDIAATLLQNLGLSSKEFSYSKNLLADSVSTGAFYTFDNGYGMINAQTKLVYDHVGGRVIFQEGPVSDSLILLGKRLLQGTFDPH